MPQKSQNPSKSPRVYERRHAIEQEAIAWFAKIQSGSLSSHDQKSFDHWRTQSLDHEEIFHDVSGMWDDPALLEATQTLSTATAHAEISPTQWQGVWNWMHLRVPQVGVAVALIGLVMIGFWHFDVLTRMDADYYTGTGEQQIVQLPDQSVITLSPQSAVAVTFTQATRGIRLIKGKAHFSVESNPDRPFIVEYDHVQARALGTEFIVGEKVDGLQVTVVEGLVKLSNVKIPWTPVLLPAQTQIRVDKSTPGAVYTIDPTIATAWLRGRLVVDTKRLQDVIHDINPYHSGTILLLNEEIANLKVSGTYNLSDTTDILSALSQTLPIHTLSFADRVTIFF